MKPSPFHYHAPTTVDEAVGLLDEFGDDAKLLAGGQSLVPMLSLRLAAFGHLIDLNRVARLDTIEDGDTEVRVGALTRQAVAERDPILAARVPLVPLALPHVGHLQTRTRGTIGGSVAHADPVAELPAVVRCLDAIAEVVGPKGTRRIEAAELFESTWETAIGDHEVLTALRFPTWAGASGFGIDEVARRHGDFALCGAVCGVTVDGERVVRAAIALFGVASTPVRAPAAEAALIAGGTTADLAAIGAEAASPLDPTDDLHAPGSYRKKVAAVAVERAVRRALDRAMQLDPTRPLDHGGVR